MGAERAGADRAGGSRRGNRGGKNRTEVGRKAPAQQGLTMGQLGAMQLRSGDASEGVTAQHFGASYASVSAPAQHFFGGGDIAGGGLVVKNTFLSFESGDCTSPLRPVKTASARLNSLVPEDDMSFMATAPGAPGQLLFADDSAAPPAKNTVTTLRKNLHEPVQINPDTLRSMSSNSLSALDPCAEEVEERPGRSSMVPQHGFAAPAEAVAGPPRAARAGLPGGYDRLLFSDTASQFQVKNTFLEFGSSETRKPLRAVHTAAGRLDLMSQGMEEE